MKTKILFLFLIVFTQNYFSQKTDSKYIPKEYVEITHPEWSKNATIYEVNIRQYTPEGTFKAFEKNLPRLKNMGIDIIWLMPIHPIGEKNRKGKLGSYYSVKDFKGVNPEFGTMQDFKHLVNEIHKLGMYVIIAVSYTHLDVYKRQGMDSVNLAPKKLDSLYFSLDS